MSNDITNSELLLQLNSKIGEIAEQLGSIESYIEAIKDSVAVLNHNSTSLDTRVALLEKEQLTSEIITKHMDDVKDSARNWIIFGCTIVGIIATILTAINLYH